VSLWHLLGICLWFFVPFVWLRAFYFKQSLFEFVKAAWPACILFGVSLLTITNIPCELGLLTSVRQFENFMRKQEPTGYSRHYLERSSSPRMHLGIYPVYDFKCDDGSYYFVTGVSGYLNVELAGFAYHPSKEERFDGRMSRSFTHLWGDWYGFQETEKF
jgi:hypothetical protein